MSRIYYLPYQGTLANSGGDADLFTILPADDKPVRIRGWIFGQTSEVADAAEEGLRITVRHMAATVTDGNGSSVTPTKTDSADASAAFTAEANGATVATTSGASTILMELAWNIRATPWEFWFPDDRFCPIAKQGEALLIRSETTPADDISIACTLIVEEL